MKNKLRILLVAFFSIFLLTGSALALTHIDFGYAGQPGGTINADSTYAIGQNIPINILTVFGNDYGFNGNGTPDFSTAGLVMNFANTPDQNYITISNTAQGNWLSGSFSTFKVDTLSPVIRISASGPDTKADWLLRDLGIPVDTQFQFFGFTIATSELEVSTASLVYQGLYTGAAFSTDIANVAAVPEPASMLLFGLGLIGLAAVRRKLK